jgi:hypothetical protein
MCMSFSYSLAPTRHFALVNHNQAQILITLHTILKAYLHSSHRAAGGGTAKLVGAVSTLPSPIESSCD